MPTLAIPNQTVKRLMYGYLRDAYEDVGVFSVNLFRFEQLMLRMANEGAWRPVLEFLGEAIAGTDGHPRLHRRREGDSGIPGRLPERCRLLCVPFGGGAWQGKGHADIAMEPLVARYPQLRRGYLIELKYLKRSETLDETGVAAAAAHANTQLLRYLSDERLERQFPACASSA